VQVLVRRRRVWRNENGLPKPTGGDRRGLDLEDEPDHQRQSKRGQGSAERMTRVYIKMQERKEIQATSKC